MATKHGDGREGGFVPSIGFSAIAGKELTGAMEDGDVTEGDPRLKDLPDFENDHLRGQEDADSEGIPPTG